MYDTQYCKYRTAACWIALILSVMTLRRENIRAICSYNIPSKHHHHQRYKPFFTIIITNLATFLKLRMIFWGEMKEVLQRNKSEDIRIIAMTVSRNSIGHWSNTKLQHKIQMSNINLQKSNIYSFFSWVLLHDSGGGGEHQGQ